jgi:hypothetical protein
MKYKVMENVSVRKGALLMKRMLSIITVVAMLLTLVAAPQWTNADAREIKVIPYPRTAGKMASYKISFNVTRPLAANQDSITVTLPKETVVPDYISSSVISINPKKLIGTDYRLNFATGGITFTNPLREGDMIKASYTYEASEEYTMMPKAVDVKYFDRCYGYAYAAPGTPPTYTTTDNRNNNGQFDPGEWVYEDRDHNNRISPGDRRLTVVKGVLGLNDAKQNSIVGPGDSDCAQDTNLSTYLNPLIPLSIIRLTMLDFNKDGIYNEGDYLFDDRDQSGTVSYGDNMIAGIAYLTAGSKVEMTDPDYNTRLANRPSGATLAVGIRPFRDPTNLPGGTYRHVDDGAMPTAFDPGEHIYYDDNTTSSYSVDPGDIRMTAVHVLRNGALISYEAGSFVFQGDADVGTRLIDFRIATGEEEGFLSDDFFYNPGEPIYRNGNGRVNFYATLPMPGDLRLSTWSLSAYEAGAIVQLTDADANQQLIAFNTNPTNKPESMIAGTNPAFIAPAAPPQVQWQYAVNTIYSFFTSSSIYYGTAATTTTNIAENWEPKTGLAIAPPPPPPLPPPVYQNPTIGALPTPLATWLYRDMDNSGSVTPGDVRLTNMAFQLGKDRVKYSADSIVKLGELDVVQTTFVTQPLPLLPLESGQALPTPTIRHQENIAVNNMYDPNEYIYFDIGADGIITGGTDWRLVPVGVVSFGNKPIGVENPLLGETLTRGWARIENKVVVPYAQAGTKTANLETTPITVLPTLVPPSPPSNLRADYLTLPGGNTALTNSGTWYIRVAAVNMYGEGEPSEPMAINFAQNSTFNAIKLSWRPIPFAQSYRIYKSKNDAYFPPNSLLAEVEGPTAEYIDKGTQITEGSLAFPYKASFVTLWRMRGGTETELVEYNCADYEIDLASGMIRFRRALRPYEIVLADYKFAPDKTPLGADLDPCKTVGHKDEHVYVDTQRGIGKLLHAPAVDPKIDPLNYCFRLWRAPMIDPKNPYLLREGSDYTINYKTGDIQFSAHVVTEGDIITADYDTFEEVAGESLVEAISTGITQAQCSSPVIPESYTIYRAVALKSSPQIRITGGAYGWQIVFTTPVDVAVDPDNDPSTPDIIMTLNRPGRQLSATNKGAVRNPEKAGMYQLWVQTSQEQTPILSEPYEIIADKDLKSAQLNIITPQIAPLLPSDPPCACKDAVATAGQATSIVAQLMAGSNGLPNTYVRFEIVSTVNPPSTFSSPNLVQTNAQGLASVVLNLSATAGMTTVKVYLQDDPSICRCITINTGPAVAIDRIVVIPGPTLALTPNSQQLFTAKAYDTHGAEISGVTFTWQTDLGVINQTGLYTAPMDPNQTAHVWARASGKEGMTTVSIITRPDRIQVTPQSAIIATGSQQKFTAQAFDKNNNPMNVPITWTIEPSALGVFDSEGNFTASLIEGTGTVKACSAGMCGTATIMIKKAADIDRIEIIPATITLNVGGTNQFVAKAYDKNGYEIQGATFVWSVNPPTSGTISTTGLFIAAQPGVSVVSVQSGQKFASAVVNIIQVQKIELTPADVRLAQGAVQTFTAVAYNTTGAPVSGVNFTWEVQPPTLGTISNGIFIATGTPGSTGAVIAKAFGMSGMAKVTIEEVDNDKPVITLVNPPTNGATVPTTMQFQMEFKVTDRSGISEVTVNGIPATVNANGNYVATIQINSGTNNIMIRAKDNSSAKNMTEMPVTIIGSCPKVLRIAINQSVGTLTEKCGMPTQVNLTAQAVILGGKTYVGLRDLGQTLFGATSDQVVYTAATRAIKITFTKSNGEMVVVDCVVGSTMARITTMAPTGSAPVEKYINLPVAPTIPNSGVNKNRTLVPIREIVEGVYGKQVVVNGQMVDVVGWDAQARAVTFTIIP